MIPVLIQKQQKYMSWAPKTEDVFQPVYYVHIKMSWYDTFGFEGVITELLTKSLKGLL